MSTCTLTGTALRERARALNIPRRSAMTASELRSAITAAESAAPTAEVAMVDLTPTIPAPRPTSLTPGCPTPFRAPRGKRKASRTRTHRRAR